MHDKKNSPKNLEMGHIRSGKTETLPAHHPSQYLRFLDPHAFGS